MKGQVPLPVSLGIALSPQPQSGSSTNDSEPEEFHKGDLCPQCKAGEIDIHDSKNDHCDLNSPQAACEGEKNI